jgi:hypothetical protein
VLGAERVRLEEGAVAKCQSRPSSSTSNWAATLRARPAGGPLVVANFADDAGFVPLGAIRGPEVPPALVEPLGTVVLSGEPLTTYLERFPDAKHVLLVLDNLELGDFPDANGLARRST